MIRPLVIVRPRPGCDETRSAAQALGLEAIAAPLFEVLPVAWEAPSPGDFSGILAGSANAFRFGGAGLGAVRSLRVHAVGARTADAARAAGFAVARAGESGLQRLVDELDSPARLLRLAGEARVGLSLPAGIEVVERTVYRAEPLSLSPDAADALATGAVVALHSGEAARRLASECERLGLDRARIAIAAFAPRIAEAAGEGWGTVRIAACPADSALLALALELCQ